jgi:hypothetical protein
MRIHAQPQSCIRLILHECNLEKKNMWPRGQATKYVPPRPRARFGFSVCPPRNGMVDGQLIRMPGILSSGFGPPAD